MRRRGGDAANARADLERAIEISKACGAKRDLERAEVALRGVATHVHES